MVQPQHGGGLAAISRGRGQAAAPEMRLQFWAKEGWRRETGLSLLLDGKGLMTGL